MERDGMTDRQLAEPRGDDVTGISPRWDLGATFGPCSDKEAEDAADAAMAAIGHGVCVSIRRLLDEEEETRNAPDILSGGEGDTVFVLRDVADTPTKACAYALEHEGANVRGLEVDEVVMLPVPEHFTGIDDSWATVREGTVGAVAYWRFRA